MISPERHDWRIILLAVVGGFGALLCLALAAATAGYTILQAWLPPLATNRSSIEDVAGAFMLSGGMILIAGVLISTLLAAIETLQGRADREFVSNPLRWWVVLSWIVVWLGASALAQFLHDRESGTWAIPVLQLLAIAGPIYVLARLAIAGIRGGTRLRLWGSVTSGMLLGTGVAAAVEVVLLLGGIAVGGIYLIANPRQMIALQHLVSQLVRAAEAEESLEVLGPVLSSPLALVLVLAAVALAAPLVEELAKSVPVWAQHDRLSKGADGFWAGALSGAGFAVLEGIMISPDANEGMALILVLRAGSSLMHIVASGLAGWGIAVFRGTGRVNRLLAGYAAGMGVHALWNAVVVAIGYGAIRSTYADAQPDPVGLILSAGGVMILVALIGFLPIALISLNLMFRDRDASSAMMQSSSGAAHSAPEAENAIEVL
jgi:hypothetical protein